MVKIYAVITDDKYAPHTFGFHARRDQAYASAVLNSFANFYYDLQCVCIETSPFHWEFIKSDDEISPYCPAEYVQAQRAILLNLRQKRKKERGRTIEYVKKFLPMFEYLFSLIEKTGTYNEHDHKGIGMTIEKFDDFLEKFQEMGAIQDSRFRFNTIVVEYDLW